MYNYGLCQIHVKVQAVHVCYKIKHTSYIEQVYDWWKCSHSTVFSILSYQSTRYCIFKGFKAISCTVQGGIFSFFCHFHIKIGERLHEHVLYKQLGRIKYMKYSFLCECQCWFLWTEIYYPVSCVEWIWLTRLAASKVGVINEQKLQILSKSKNV